MSRRCKSKSSWLELVPSQERVKDDGHSDQRQRHKSEPDFRAGEILSSYHTDLGADDCASVHNQCDQNIHVPLDCVSKRSVTGRDYDLKKVRSDSQMSGNAEHVNHRRHSDVACAAAEKPAEKSTNKRDQKYDPERNFLYTRRGQAYHWPNSDLLNLFRDWLESRMVCFRFGRILRSALA